MITLSECVIGKAGYIKLDELGLKLACVTVCLISAVFLSSFPNGSRTNTLSSYSRC